MKVGCLNCQQNMEQTQEMMSGNGKITIFRCKSCNNAVEVAVKKDEGDE